MNYNCRLYELRSLRFLTRSKEAIYILPSTFYTQPEVGPEILFGCGPLAWKTPPPPPWWCFTCSTPRRPKTPPPWCCLTFSRRPWSPSLVITWLAPWRCSTCSTPRRPLSTVLTVTSLAELFLGHKASGEFPDGRSGCVPSTWWAWYDDRTLGGSSKHD